MSQDGAFGAVPFASVRGGVEESCKSRPGLSGLTNVIWLEGINDGLGRVLVFFLGACVQAR